jgi:DNA-binding NarL/FixJ family response regulator
MTLARIYIVDDHPMLREGLIHLIRRNGKFKICGEAGTAAQAFDAIPSLLPDLVLMDLTLPDKGGLELIKDLRALCPAVPILVLSMHDEMRYAVRWVESGEDLRVEAETE